MSFRFFTISQAEKEFEGVADDLLDGLVSSETTIMFGASGVGKGRLLAEMITAGILGQDYAGRRWSKTLQRVAIIGTDAGSAKEYSKLLRRAGLGIEHEGAVKICAVDSAPSSSEWSEITGAIVGWAPDLVVLDSTTEAVRGSVNDDVSVKSLWHDLAPFHRVGRSVPLLLVHHVGKPSADNGGRRGRTPVGSGLWENFARNKVLVREGYRRDDADVTIEARPRYGAVWEAHFVNDEESGQLVYRAASTADDLAGRRQRRQDDQQAKHVAVADFIVNTCQGDTPTAVSRKVAEEFPDLSASARDRPRAIAQALAKGERYGALLTGTAGV